MTRPSPLDAGPPRFQPAQFSFVTAGLREAVQLAGELRQVLPTDVRVRPARLTLAGARKWVVLVLTPPLGASLVLALEDELRRVALRFPGRRFLGRIHTNGASAAHGAEARVEEAKASMRFVIIDASEPFRKAARGILEAGGHRVVGEADGAALGFGAVERAQPDAVLLDVHLPDGSGLDLCTLLIAQTPAPAVLLVSHHDLEETRVAEQWGACAFSLKARLEHFDFESLRH